MRSFRYSGGAAKPQAVCSRTRLERTQECDPHQYGIAFPVLETQRTGTAELEFVRIALLTAVATDQERVEILDPLPDEPMQILNSIVVRRSQSHAGQWPAGGLSVPVQNPRLPLCVAARIMMTLISGGG